MELPGLNFELGEDIDMLRHAVREFAVHEIAPLAAETDRTDQFPMHLWQKFGELGVLGMTVPEEYGGANMGYLAHMVAMEEISRPAHRLACPMVRTPTYASTRSIEMGQKHRKKNIYPN